jgi:hypothetical protein
VRPTLLLAIFLGLALALLLFLRRQAADTPHAGSAPRVAEAAPRSAAPPVVARAGASPQAGPRPDRAAARARRDELRARILQALADRSRGAPPRAPAAVQGTTTTARPPGNLVDRTGRGRSALVQALNTDFMPLAQECLEQAKERTPGLKGVVVLAVETVADDQVGAVVDIASPAALNDVPDEELFECLRESAFSLSLPPPPEGGREKFDISMPIK